MEEEIEREAEVLVHQDALIRGNRRLRVSTGMYPMRKGDSQAVRGRHVVIAAGGEETTVVEGAGGIMMGPDGGIHMMGLIPG